MRLPYSKVPLYRGTLLIKNADSSDPAVAMFLGTYGDARGVGVSYERGTPACACPRFLPQRVPAFALLSRLV